MRQMVEITCACGCGQKRLVAKADRKRGWGKYINKSHKARHQERNTHQYSDYLNSLEESGEFVLSGPQPT